MEIPVYLFTGFLDAGKTGFIQETLENEDFNTKENTLVILCEEGEGELCPKKFKTEKVSVETIDDIDDIDEKKLNALAKKHSAKRVIIEYNGMWQLDDLYKNLPKEWSVYQEILTADANTFEMYNSNMRSLVVDKLQSCEVVMFNRVEKTADIMPLHKIVRSVSRRANIAYEYTDGEVVEDTIKDPLPFDINADVIEIEDNDYGIWYRDLAEETQKYVGKVLKFKGIVGKDQSLGEKAFIFGRHVMTCCEDDIAFQGLVCKTKEPTELNNRDWAIITAKLIIAEHKVYGGEGPVLIVKETEKSTVPKQEVVSLM